MKKYLDDELNDAMNKLEVLVNSEHRDLILDVLSSYVRKRSVDKSKFNKASVAMRSMFTT